MPLLCGLPKDKDATKASAVVFPIYALAPAIMNPLEMNEIKHFYKTVFDRQKESKTWAGLKKPITDFMDKWKVQ